MKKLSVWASQHIWKSRMIIFVSYFILLVIAAFLGIFLAEFGILFSHAFFYVLTGVYIVLIVAYPVKRFALALPYWKRKVFDLMMVGITFLLFCCIGNQPLPESGIVFKATAATPNIMLTNNPTGLTGSAIQNPEIVKKPKLTKSQQRKQLRKIVKAYKKKFDGAPTGVKILLILLTIVVAAGLLYIIAALSCSIACSSAAGSGALANVVFFGGLAGLLVGMFFVIRRIIRGPKQKTKEQEKGK